MLEYVFFNDEPMKLFQAYLDKHGVPATSIRNEENFEIAIPEDLNDNLIDDIEDYYDEVSDMDQRLVEEAQADSEDNYHMASILVTLQDGRSSYADVSPELLSKLMQVITPQELGKVVQAITQAVENPDDRLFCQRVRDGDFKFDEQE